jgi:hypothetical protein
MKLVMAARATGGFDYGPSDPVGRQAGQELRDDGVVEPEFEASFPAVIDVMVQSNGRIVLVGQASDSDFDVAVARLLP